MTRGIAQMLQGKLLDRKPEEIAEGLASMLRNAEFKEFLSVISECDGVLRQLTSPESSLSASERVRQEPIDSILRWAEFRAQIRKHLAELVLKDPKLRVLADQNPPHSRIKDCERFDGVAGNLP